MYLTAEHLQCSPAEKAKFANIYYNTPKTNRSQGKTAKIDRYQFYKKEPQQAAPFVYNLPNDRPLAFYCLFKHTVFRHTGVEPDMPCN